ncbi:MAG: xylulokinase [Candidatus Limnocylindria bacterium]
MTARRAFLGIDCGTQSTKALLADADTGDILSLGQAAHEIVERPDGTREQDPAWWIAAAVVAVTAALARAGDALVAGIAVSGQQHGLVCLDETDRPLRRAKLWNDTTTAAECVELERRVGGRERALALTGNVFLSGYTAPKILWLARREPEVYAAARRFCLPHEYLDLWLTGQFAAEPGDASGTAYFDVRARRYSDAVLAAIDGDRVWEAALPPLVRSLAVIGTLREDAAGALGLEAGIPVSAGGGDNMCTAIAVGVTAEGPAAVSLGTSGTAFAFSATAAVDPEGEAAAFCDSTGAWLPLGCTLNCTSATEWICSVLGFDHARFEAALVATPPGADDLAFLPYLDGERTPSVPDAAGLFAGLRIDHRPDHLVRAVAEGVTFGLVYAMAALARAGVRPSSVVVTGGGSRSEAWTQLCADALAMPVTRAEVPEAAAAGAALQARWAIDGRRPDPPRVQRVFEPRTDERLVAAAARVSILRELARSGKV